MYLSNQLCSQPCTVDKQQIMFKTTYTIIVNAYELVAPLEFSLLWKNKTHNLIAGIGCQVSAINFSGLHAYRAEKNHHMSMGSHTIMVMPLHVWWFSAYGFYHIYNNEYALVCINVGLHWNSVC